jgi:TolB-like protein/Tfp pilus assembly protein PilF
MADEGVQEDILEGWKAIADHLHKTERTAQRWERTRGLPVRRLKASSPEEGSRVFAYKTELDAWWQEQLSRPDPNPDSNGDDPTPAPEPPTPSDPNLDLNRERPQRSPSFWVAVALGAVLIAVGLRWAVPEVLRKFRPLPGKITLAVRPFKNLSGESGEDFVAAGITEEMVSRLGQLHPQHMSVIRLTPAYAAAQLERLSQDLHVDYVLEGSVRRIGDQVAATAQLVQVSNQTVVWGESYDRDLQHLLLVEKELADAIAGEVFRKLPLHSAPAREVNRDAYLAYLEGRYFWNKRTSASLTQALALFKKSIAIDPTYAPPYAGLADCYELLGSAPFTTLSPSQAFPQAEDAARKALQLDETLAEAHVSLGYSETVYEWNLPQARKEFVRALQLRPDYATAHQFYAYYLTAIGNLDAAVAERKRALELEPINPLLTSALGEAYYQQRQFDRTIEQNSKSLELDPSYAIALVNIGRAYELKGMHTEARDAFQKILSVSPDNPAVLALLGHEYAVSGETAEANQILQKLKEVSGHTYVSPIYFALVYTGLHDLNHAFQWLEAARKERSEYLVYLPSEPLADPLRNDPRFPRLLKQVGLQPLNLPVQATN